MKKKVVALIAVCMVIVAIILLIVFTGKDSNQQNVNNQENNSYETNQIENGGENQTTQNETNTQQTVNYKENGQYLYRYPEEGAETDNEEEIITLKDGNITFKMDYFSEEKTSNYVIQGNKLIATYTKKTSLSQSQDKKTTENINEKVTYTIEEGKLNISENDYNKVYTKGENSLK